MNERCMYLTELQWVFLLFPFFSHGEKTSKMIFCSKCKYVPLQHPGDFWICNVYLRCSQISHTKYISQRHTSVRKHWELKLRVYVAQEVLKIEIWAPPLKKLTTAVRKWGITMGWARRGIRWRRPDKWCREGPLLAAGLTEIVRCWWATRCLTQIKWRLSLYPWLTFER